MSIKLNYIPFTYLVGTTTKNQFELYVCIPVAKGERIVFDPLKPAVLRKDNQVRNKIHFIDCKVASPDHNGHDVDCTVVDSDDKVDYIFKCFTLDQVFPKEDETMEVRVRIRNEKMRKLNEENFDNLNGQGNSNKNEENIYIEFNRTIAFFEDIALQGVVDRDIMLEIPYYFIGKPKDFFSSERIENPEFPIHFLMARSGSKVLTQTEMTRKGIGIWTFDPNQDRFMELSEILAKTRNNMTGRPILDNQVAINIREGIGRVDKPETPPLGSSGGGG